MLIYKLDEGRAAIYAPAMIMHDVFWMVSVVRKGRISPEDAFQAMKRYGMLMIKHAKARDMSRDWQQFMRKIDDPTGVLTNTAFVDVPATILDDFLKRGKKMPRRNMMEELFRRRLEKLIRVVKRKGYCQSVRPLRKWDGKYPERILKTKSKLRESTIYESIVLDISTLILNAASDDPAVGERSPILDLALDIPNIDAATEEKANTVLTGRVVTRDTNRSVRIIRELLGCIRLGIIPSSLIKPYFIDDQQVYHDVAMKGPLSVELQNENGDLLLPQLIRDLAYLVMHARDPKAIDYLFDILKPWLRTPVTRSCTWIFPAVRDQTQTLLLLCRLMLTPKFHRIFAARAMFVFPNAKGWIKTSTRLIKGIFYQLKGALGFGESTEVFYKLFDHPHQVWHGPCSLCGTFDSLLDCHQLLDCLLTRRVIPSGTWAEYQRDDLGCYSDQFPAPKYRAHFHMFSEFLSLIKVMLFGCSAESFGDSPKARKAKHLLIMDALVAREHVIQDLIGVREVNGNYVVGTSMGDDVNSIHMFRHRVHRLCEDHDVKDVWDDIPSWSVDGQLQPTAPGQEDDYTWAKTTLRDIVSDINGTRDQLPCNVKSGSSPSLATHHSLHVMRTTIFAAQLFLVILREQKKRACAPCDRKERRDLGLNDEDDDCGAADDEDSATEVAHDEDAWFNQGEEDHREDVLVRCV